MGVPKFFRYISERYPCLSELARDEKIPEFDNLYLDMNGIIHNCSHPDDGNVHFRITEDDMFRDIFNYIDKLFFLIKPTKLFFLAVDGVAPRAKMNQQRSRRFRSAKEAETLEKNAIKRGEILPNEARFDSNCITPGTEFMVRLQNALKYFIKQKITSNSLWQTCRVILSGHETPGEGEHKIMEYIRYLKSQKGYDPYTRHCLYGLDADLIILGLCTHELHFSLLREEVLFGKKAKRTSAEETRFFLLHLNLLREYLELEFSELKNEKDFDLDKLIDDWILMGFLVGNDFIPHLPNMHIHANALPKLYKAYTTVWPELGGYINENGELNLERLEKFFEVLEECDVQFFETVNADLKYLESKKLFKDECETFDFDTNDVRNMNMDEELDKLIQATNDFMNDDENDFDYISEKEFASYKRDYYINKLKYEEMTQDVLNEQTECYVTALQWILYYYYKGVQSWGWFYPHHYAPFVSDLKNLKRLSIKFDLGKPFLPFQQLLAVLPAASKELLPAAFRELMTNQNSSLIKYYPTEFETDLNGKKQDWEAVVLIPFIDEAHLLNAMQACLNNLTPDERERNIHGPMLQYDYTSISQGECEGIYSFKTIPKVFCTEIKIWRDEISVSKSNGNFRRPVNNVFYPGFPTMKHLKYTAELRNERVKVFEQHSRNDNMILLPDNTGIYNLEDASEKYLNKEVFIGWPHLTQAKIIALSTKDKKVEKPGEFIINNHSTFNMNYRTIVEHHMGRMGIDFKNISIIVHARILSGTEYHCTPSGKLNLVNVWESMSVPYPIQGVVKEISARNQDIKRSIKVEDYFPVGARIYMLSHPYFGSEGKVLDPMMVYTCGRLKVSITVLPEPDFSEAKLIQSDLEAQYLSSYEAGTAIGIDPNCLLRATGSILIIPGAKRNDVPDNSNKIQIGLHLRFPRNNEELAGYTRKSGNTWLFSSKALKLVEEYLQRYPQIFNLLYKGYSNAVFFESDLFPEQVGENCLSEITNWLKEQDHIKAERIPCGTKSVEKATLQSIIESIEKLKELPVKNVKLQVKPHLIVKPNTKIPSFCRKRKLNLFDRVVLTKDLHQIGAGHKGTIISLHPVLDLNPVRIECVKAVETFYEILIDKELPGESEMHGLAKGRIFKVSENSVLQISDEEIKSNTEQTNDKPLDLSNETKKGISSIESKSFQPVEKRFVCAKNGEQQKYIPNGNIQSANKNNRESIKVAKSDNINEEPFTATKGSDLLKSFKAIKITSGNYLARYSPPVREEILKVNHASQFSESVNSNRQNTTAKQNSSKTRISKTNVKGNEEESHKNITKQKMQTSNNRNLNGGNTELLQPKLMGSPKSSDGTEALKKLLGIDGNADKKIQKTYILKNDLSNIKPPQPPPSWRIEPKKTSNNMPSLLNVTSNRSIPNTSSFISEASTIPVFQMSQPPKKVQTNNQHHQPPQDSPSSSYHYTWPEVSVPGAFIPLQALTGKRRQHKNKHDQSIKQEERRSEAGEIKRGDQVPEVCATPTTDHSKHKRNRPIKARTPRIAAKFDFTQ